MKFSMDPPRLADSAAGAAVNAVINGAIAWSAFKASDAVPLSVDSIGAKGVTALGNAATVAFALTLIITCITFFVFRGGARKASAAASLREMPFLPTGLGIALSNTLLAFGAFVAIAVLWQRFAGTVEVGPGVATVVVALVAGLATAFAEWRTKREMVGRAGFAR
jgi:cbb3-type cytochrome oxidase subunit 3